MLSHHHRVRFQTKENRPSSLCLNWIHTSVFSNLQLHLQPFQAPFSGRLHPVPCTGSSDRGDQSAGQMIRGTVHEVTGSGGSAARGLAPGGGGAHTEAAISWPFCRDWWCHPGKVSKEISDPKGIQVCILRIVVHGYQYFVGNLFVFLKCWRPGCPPLLETNPSASSSGDKPNWWFQLLNLVQRSTYCSYYTSLLRGTCSRTSTVTQHTKGLQMQEWPQCSILDPEMDIPLSRVLFTRLPVGPKL